MIDCRFLFTLPLALLAACNDAPAGKTGQGGQVLQGSISDEMLPVERLTSEPPVMAPEPDKTSAAADPAEEPSDAPTDASSGTPAAATSEAAD